MDHHSPRTISKSPNHITLSQPKTRSKHKLHESNRKVKKLKKREREIHQKYSLKWFFETSNGRFEGSRDREGDHNASTETLTTMWSMEVDIASSRITYLDPTLPHLTTYHFDHHGNKFILPKWWKWIIPYTTNYTGIDHNWKNRDFTKELQSKTLLEITTWLTFRTWIIPTQRQGAYFPLKSRPDSSRTPALLYGFQA